MSQSILLLLQIITTIVCGELAIEKCVQNCLRRRHSLYESTKDTTIMQYISLQPIMVQTLAGVTYYQ
jgi:hypothetical protein